MVNQSGELQDCSINFEFYNDVSVVYVNSII